MLWPLWLVLSLLFPAPTTVQAVTITERVTERVFVPIELRGFHDGDEIRDYLEDKPALMAADGQDCDDLAWIFTYQLRRSGYDVFPQYLDATSAAAYGFPDKHMLVMAMTADNAIYYIDPGTNRLWWVSVID